jgi:hypothetical protein
MKKKPVIPVRRDVRYEEGYGFSPELLLEAFEEPLTINRSFIEMTGFIAAGMMLTSAVKTSSEFTVQQVVDGKWFSRTREQWQKIAYLNDLEYVTARRRLVELSLLQVRPSLAPGGPDEYRVNTEQLAVLMQRQAESRWKLS